MDKKLIYCLEDDENIKDLLKYAITDAGYDVLCFENVQFLFNDMKARLPNLIILDIMLEDSNVDGIEALKNIRENYSNVDIKIIMLTAKSNEMSKVNALNLGADDYITKPFSILELIARIKANLRKKTVYNEDNTIVYHSIKMFIDKRLVLIKNREVNLTHKEFELLKILMLNAGNVVDRQKIFNEVWGYDTIVETRTIDMHIKNIREKLALKKDIISTVHGVGYKLIWI